MPKTTLLTNGLSIVSCIVRQHQARRRHSTYSLRGFDLKAATRFLLSYSNYDDTDVGCLFEGRYMAAY